MLFVENANGNEIHDFMFDVTVTNGAAANAFNDILAVNAPDVNLEFFIKWSDADIGAGQSDGLGFLGIQIAVGITPQMRGNISAGKYVPFCTSFLILICIFAHVIK